MVIKLQSFNNKTPFLSIWAIQAVVIRVTHIHFLEKDLLGYRCNEYGVASLQEWGTQLWAWLNPPPHRLWPAYIHFIQHGDRTNGATKI